jgi:hypothetical protein
MPRNTDGNAGEASRYGGRWRYFRSQALCYSVSAQTVLSEAHYKWWQPSVDELESPMANSAHVILRGLGTKPPAHPDRAERCAMPPVFYYLRRCG